MPGGSEYFWGFLPNGVMAFAVVGCLLGVFVGNGVGTAA